MTKQGLSGDTGKKRKKGKKVGGQKGHKGHRLELSPKVDHTVCHELPTCKCCGQDLESSEIVRTTERQIYDIPIIKMQVTSHQVVD